MKKLSDWEIETVQTEPHVWDDLYRDQDLSSYADYYGVRRFAAPAGVLLVDPYEDVFSPRGVQDGDEQTGSRSLDVLRGVSERARDAGLRIHYSTNEHREEARASGAVTHRARGSDFDAAAAFAIRSEVAPQPGDFVVYKSRASAFHGTPLNAQLQLTGIRTLIVGGYTTSGCLRATVVDAYAAGYHVIVVEDGTGDRSPVSHAANLFDMHHKYATVVPSNSIEKLLAELS